MYFSKFWSAKCIMTVLHLCVCPSVRLFPGSIRGTIQAIVKNFIGLLVQQS